jgi:RNA-directed DNA polymerase
MGKLSSPVVAKKTFARNDHNICLLLWQWAARRHPNKGAKWVKEKYFKTYETRNWGFTALNDDKQQEITLLKEADMLIKRHINIQSAANPHDLKWRAYFEARGDRKRRNTQ